METMRYKPLDKVRIKSLDWYNKNKDKDGNIVFSSKVPHFSWCVNVQTVFTKDMVKFCGKVVTIESVWTVNYSIEEGTYRYYFTDEMIEGLAEEIEIAQDTKTFSEGYEQGYEDGQHDMNEWVLPEGYVFKNENGNVINATKIVLEKKKKEYPKTYEECAGIMRVEMWNTLWGEDATEYEEQTEDLIDAFIRLKVCRDAYWKIAGENMGFGKSWKPSKDKMVYSFYRHSNEIETACFSGESVTFEFPTAEMRDAFKENFDPDIEICKEFL